MLTVKEYEQGCQKEWGDFVNILFIEIDPQYLLGLPPAFEEHGCEVKILNDIIEEELEQLLSKFRPDLLVTAV
ncbi:hypothetical protein Dred_3252 [Desulforamulus reducens MI-1]|uniref:Spore protein YkvP N-terminal domain-containing protein n=1 Tax=Desulforamulus reducens (strain ATCC BAA-1160 / DSM 100696 / MI-1) TaxID=349161 RepID=A4J9J9_DESRM|nr:hypothetical protein [Desulforamulus reducens]ABO51752.1 hypothetical protein Dred_3252 [Desulforamulus reducens MI-1]